MTICDYVLDTNTSELVKGSTLYQSDDGKAVIVMGNESEVMPNILVTVTDSKGKVLQFAPQLSGYDGHIVLPDSPPTVYDFTEYAKLGYTESGSFDSSILYSTDSWTVYADTTDGDTLSLSLQFYEDGHAEMCREVYGGSGYKVYYEGLWYPAYDPTLPQSTMMFELQLKRNRSNIDVPVCIAGAASFDYDQYNDWVYMTHEDGQPLLDNAVDTMQIMHPSMG